MRIERFEDIEAWRLARSLTRDIYNASRQSAFAKDFPLRDQIRGAVGSIMHNIAEGFDGGSNAEFTRFLGYAQRSCTEVQSQLYVALDQEYLSPEQFRDLYQLARHTHAKIGAFIKYLRQHRRSGDISSTKNKEPRTKNVDQTTIEHS